MKTTDAASGRAWQAVRRTLGRLIAHADVRDVPSSEMRPPVAVRTAAFASAPTVSGAREHAWKPAGNVRRALVPQAEAGARNDDWQPAVRLVEDTAVPAPPLCREMPVVQAARSRVENADLLLPSFVVRLPDAFLTLPSAPVRVQSAGLLAPAAGKEKAVKGWGIAAPKSRPLRLPRVPEVRVRWGGDAVMGRIALTRRGQEPPPGVSFGRAFAAEQRRLAEAAQLPPGDVTLLGVYPGVPILAVSRIVVAEEGRALRLWLKPDVLRGRGRMRLITLLVGRQDSSGKMLQAAL